MRISTAATASGGSAQVQGTTPAVPVLGMVGLTDEGETLLGDTLLGDTVVVVVVVGIAWQTSPQVTTGPAMFPDESPGVTKTAFMSSCPHSIRGTTRVAVVWPARMVPLMNCLGPRLMSV